MAGISKNAISIILGIIIAIADVYWMYTSYYYTPWLVLGIIIFVADVIWLYIDYSYTKIKTKR